MSLPGILLFMFAASAVVITALYAAYRSRMLAPCRIKEDPTRRVRGFGLWARVVGNATLSAIFVVGLSLLLERVFMHGGSDPWWRVLWQAVAILLVYDFLYYFMHRYAFHQWAWLKKVHTVHHLVRHPTAPDSLYLHPIENLMGLSLLFSCIALFGPVSLVTFGIIITVHSLVNVVVHCGLDVPVFGMRVIGYLARKHDLHHTSMRGGNYASITPFWDKLFGTAE
ncbi:MAG: sterol desaturase family protein [Deltaproteobacteria bacterium]|nr:sterol desaturase family protein [Deltaproteobacteria bacterium]